MKKTIFLFLIFLPLLLFAQHSQSSNKTASKGSGSAFGGKTEIDSVKYTEFRVIPEFKIWKLGIGLDLDFLLDHNYHLRKSDWDQLKDIPSKFYYIKYQKRGDPFYAQLGSLSGYGYSNGLVMMNYSNNRLFPDLKNTAFMAGGNPNILTKPSFEAMTSSIEKNQILAFNTHFKPVPDSTVKYLDRTVLGLTIATDRNQYGNLKYVASDSLYHAYKEKENAVTAFSFDYSLPVSKKREMTFGHYAEFSHIAGHGSGFIFPGFYGEYKFLKVNLEFRGYGPHYLPSFFDNRYEQTRAYQIGDSLVFTKEDMLKGIKSSSGWFGKVQISIKEIQDFCRLAGYVR